MLESIVAILIFVAMFGTPIALFVHAFRKDNAVTLVLAISVVIADIAVILLESAQTKQQAVQRLGQETWTLQDVSALNDLDAKFRLQYIQQLATEAGRLKTQPATCSAL